MVAFSKHTCGGGRSQISADDSFDIDNRSTVDVWLDLISD